MIDIAAILMVQVPQLIAEEDGNENDVGWDKAGKNFSLAIFDPVGAIQELEKGDPPWQTVAWLCVRRIEDPWGRSPSHRTIFGISMVINMLAGNLFRQVNNELILLTAKRI